MRLQTPKERLFRTAFPIRSEQKFHIKIFYKNFLFLTNFALQLRANACEPETKLAFLPLYTVTIHISLSSCPRHIIVHFRDSWSIPPRETYPFILFPNTPDEAITSVAERCEFFFLIPNTPRHPRIFTLHPW